MESCEGKAFRAHLTTKGRRTGKAHTVMLRAVMYGGDVYFSRHRPDGDWFQNAKENPKVIVEFNDQRITGIADIITDETLSQKISNLKYPGEERAKEKRVTLRIKIKA